MPRSDARRERLASPLALGVTGTAFVAAFVALALSRGTSDVPARAANDPGGDQDVSATVPAPDALTLAYLRARAAAGQLGDREAVDALVSLAMDGRVTDAQALFGELSSLLGDPADRRRIELEIAAAEWRRAVTPADRERADIVLRARLEGLRSTDAGTVRVRLLERGAALAAQLDDRAAIVSLHTALAAVEPDRASHWFGRCGQLLGARGAWQAATDCLRRAELASVRATDRFRWQLERLAISGDDPDRSKLAETLLATPGATSEQLQALATVLLASEMPGSASRAYARLATSEPEAADRWLPQAARWAEAAGEPARAAVWLERLLASGAMPASEGVRHAREIERLLLAAGDEATALARIDARIAQAPEDAELLDEAVRLADSVGAVADALRWNTAYLVGRDDDAVAVDRQVSLAMATGQPALARRWAERALRRDPDDAERRRQLAQLAEWTAAPELALEQQRWLADREGGAQAHRQVARLAESLRRPAVAADALRELARRDDPDDAEVTKLVRQYELDGRPDEAAAALTGIMERHGDTAWRWRALAQLHGRHLNQEEALRAWEGYAARIGRTAEETLARIELHWNLNERDAAVALAQELADNGFTGPATDHQATLLAEIGWRYRLPVLAELARPLIAELSDEEQRLRQARRAIDALEDAGQPGEALRAAESLWQRSGDGEFALLALRLATDGGDTLAAERWLRVASEDEALVATAGYWVLHAGVDLQRGDSEAARQAYEKAIERSPDDPEANGGLLWLAIADNRTDELRRLLDERLERVEHLPTLWPAIAVAHLSAGRPAASLPWFERALQSVGSDYGLVLSWADALERSGQVDRSRQVRAFAVDELRPHLVNGVAGHEEDLLRQYGQVLARHGSPDDNEAWMRLMLATDLADDLDGVDAARIWREDMAIAWLMSTERHEHARLIMARRHEARLATPVWQDMALALRLQDRQAIDAMLASGAGLSDGNRMLALRATGRDAEAFALALRTLDAPASAADLAVAQSQYVQMRRYRPSHVSAGFAAGRIGDLSIGETAFALRHAPGVSGFGIALDVTDGRFDSDTLRIDGRASAADVRLGLFRRDSRTDLALSVGVDTTMDEQRVYGQLDGAIRDRRARHEVGLSLGWQEPADESAELRLAGKRDRVRLSLDSSLGDRLFSRLELKASELRARASDERLASGLGTRAQIGLRDTAGSLAWSASVSAEHLAYDRAERLPDAFKLSSESTLDRVLAERRTALTLNGTLSRGGTQSDFPDMASPRWYLAAGAGHVWPEQVFGLQLDAGAGVRVVGNDELGIALGHEQRIGTSGSGRDATRLGVNYRYHF